MTLRECMNARPSVISFIMLKIIANLTFDGPGILIFADSGDICHSILTMEER